jgi:hypothetical protein
MTTPDSIASPGSAAAWLVVGLLTDGIDCWVGDDERIYQHGPEEARARWKPTLRALYVPLRCYLDREVYPCR